MAQTMGERTYSRSVRGWGTSTDVASTTGTDVWSGYVLPASNSNDASTDDAYDASANDASTDDAYDASTNDASAYDATAYDASAYGC